MLLVQEYLKTHTFRQLADEHGVYASFSKSGHKFSLNYDQIEAKENDLLAQECRGLILSLSPSNTILDGTIDTNGKINRDHMVPGPTEVVAFPMRRFFNAGQGSAAPINWLDPKLQILEKLDGTLCILYYDKIINSWCVATRSVPEADIPLDNKAFTFRTLFEKALKETVNLSFDEFTSTLNTNITYCFELCTPYNVIVVKHFTNTITLLAARDLSTLKEIDVSNLNVCNIPNVKAYSLNKLDEIIDFVSSLNPLEHEGVVVLDSNFNRIKVKNASYVAFSKLRDTLGTSDRNCLELILSEKDDDTIVALPQEIADNLLKIKSGVVKMFKDYDLQYQSILSEANNINLNDKKTFAITLQNRKELWQTPFFHMYSGKSSNMKEFISKSRKEGTWTNSLLDNILEISAKYNQ